VVASTLLPVTVLLGHWLLMIRWFGEIVPVQAQAVEAVVSIPKAEAMEDPMVTGRAS